MFIIELPYNTNNEKSEKINAKLRATCATAQRHLGELLRSNCSSNFKNNTLPHSFKECPSYANPHAS